KHVTILETRERQPVRPGFAGCGLYGSCQQQNEVRSRNAWSSFVEVVRAC
ncbi:unnamed protein product, partial [Nesidiocoris tenuis]